MEVRKDFPKRVAKLAESTPREAIANLLSALLPRVPAITRPAAPYTPPSELYGSPEPYTPDPMAKLKRRRGPTRTRKPRSAKYRVLNHGAKWAHRGWRGAMVAAVVEHNTEQDALAWLAANYPKYVHKGVDVSWCVQQGYITFNLGED